MDAAQVDIFEKLKAQLESMHQEMSVMAKKSPNDAVNAFKIRFVNSTLAECNEFFGEKYLPYQDFKMFSPDDLPTNSDVTFILSQYIECAEKFRADNIKQFSGAWVWAIDGDAKLRTSVPKRIISK